MAPAIAMTPAIADLPLRSAERDTEEDLLDGEKVEEGRPGRVQPFEEDLSGGGGGGEGGESGEGGEGGEGGEDDTGGRRKRRPKWRRVSDMRRSKPGDVDIYSTKKTVTQGFMDVALLSANADQLRTLVTRGDPNSPFLAVCIVFLSCSIVLQVVIAVCLMLKGRYNINKQHHFRRAEVVNNICMIASILLTVFNVLASSFTGNVPPMPTGEAASSVLDIFRNALTVT